MKGYTMTRIVATRDNLNDLMEFDHVVRVHPDGSVTDAESGCQSESDGWAVVRLVEVEDAAS